MLAALYRRRTDVWQLAGSATGVLAMTTVGTIVVRMASSVTLTRLLSPEAFGLVGIIGSIFFTIQMLTDLGFIAFVVRHPEGDDPRFRNVIWTIHAWRGAVLTVASIAAAPGLAWALAKPELTWPLVGASVILLLNGVASLSLITCLRSGGAKRLSLIEFYLVVVQTVICVLLALWLRNVWALILGMIAQAVFRTVLSYTHFEGSRQRFARDRDWSREFWLFSRVVLASSFLSLLIAQSDKLLLARMFTIEEFGLYAIALNLIMAPNAFVGAYVSRVLYPVFARTWHDARDQLRHVYYAKRRLTSLLYALGSGGLIGGAPLLIALLYDPRYHSVAPYLALLGISSALRMPVHCAAELMTAIGKVKATLQSNIVRLIWIAIAVPAGFLWLGTLGVIVAVGLLELPVLLFGWWMLAREQVLDLREEVAQLAVMLTGAGLGYGVSLVTLTAFPGL